jgi:hypothetical protein
VLAFECWQGVQTQWRSGMSGTTGLDYAGVRAHLDELQDARRLPRKERPDVWRCIQAAEVATLAVWSERREREANKPPPPGPVIPSGL